ncbi:hypothetical protein A3Q56_04226, partial [Intoshia linei]
MSIKSNFAPLIRSQSSCNDVSLNKVFSSDGDIETDWSVNSGPRAHAFVELPNKYTAICLINILSKIECPKSEM